MKKLVLLVAAVISLNTAAFADSSANIRINIQGAVSDNTYFLCLPNVGCLSILAGDRGKVYPVYHPIEMDNIFVTNVDHNFKLSAEGLPASCNVTVQTNHTVTISGRIVPLGNGNTELAGLHCHVS